MRANPPEQLGPLLENWTRNRQFRLRPLLRRGQRRLLALITRIRMGRQVADVDYRDRISVATWMVVLGWGLSLLVRLPTAEVSFWALGSPVAISITGTLLAAFFLAIMAAAGAESVVSVHPLFVARQARIHTWSFWALPMALAIITTVLLPLVSSALMQVVALALSGVLLAAAYFGLYATVERGKPRFRRSRLWLDALAYGSALILFLFVYQTRTRSLLSGTLVAVTAMLLAAEILRTATPRSSAALTYSGIIGLVLGQVTWALNYWVLPGLTGGLLLLLIFYLLVGIGQQGLQERLTARVMWEFVIFGLMALALIALVGPGFSFATSP
ncbi:MAG: hypothetical protein IT328_05820 [Caldilineaceae bacterium]|nr:hypothetical protein [Caldilineaceae bacterium]